MIKQLLLITLLVLSYLGNAQVRLETDLELENLNGSVQSVEASTFELVKEKEVLKKRVLSSYHQTGGLVEQKRILADKDILLRACQYSASGAKGNETIYSEDGQEEFSKITRIYSSDKLTSEITTNGDLITKEEARYYKEGLLYKRSITLNKDIQAHTEQYKEGVLVRKVITSYTEDRAMFIYFQYEYDGDKLVKQDVLDNTESLMSQTLFTYNEDDKITLIQVTNLVNGKRAVQYEKEFVYDKKGRIIQDAERNYQHKDIFTEKIQTYDEFYNVTSLKEINPLGHTIYLVYYKYKYDKHDNWVKRQTFRGEDKQLISKTVRVIEYF